MKILAINPGSTSTKIALFEDEQELFNTNLDLTGIDYNSDDGEGNLQKLKDNVIKQLTAHGYDLADVDVFSGRGGSMAYSEGGVYEINDLLLGRSAYYKNGKAHAATYSPQLTADLAAVHGKKAYVLNSQTVDELQITARMTGNPDIWRISGIHVLNHKAVAEMAAKAVGKKYEEANIIVAHLGGGCSIVAHKKGKMVDYSGASGEGPIQPNRSGTVPLLPFIEQCFSGKYTKQDMITGVILTGGLKGHLGTGDGIEIEKRIGEGDQYAKDVYDTMIYQISKYIGSMAVTLEGEVDAIALTGGISNSKYVVSEIRRQTEWLAPVQVYAGEYEMEALAVGALKVCRGEAEALQYTDTDVFDISEYLAENKR